MTLIGIAGGVELAVLFVCGMIWYLLYAVGRERSQNRLTSDADKKAEIR